MVKDKINSSSYMETNTPQKIISAWNVVTKNNYISFTIARCNIKKKPKKKNLVGIRTHDC